MATKDLSTLAEGNDSGGLYNLRRSAYCVMRALAEATPRHGRTGAAATGE